MKYLLMLLLPGCSLFTCPVDEPANRMNEDYQDARDDGAIDEAEIKLLDRDSGYLSAALEEKSQPFKLPTTGIPWLDALAAGGTFLAGLYGTHKYTMNKRDKTSPQRVKAALEKTA